MLVDSPEMVTILPQELTAVEEKTVQMWTEMFTNGVDPSIARNIVMQKDGYLVNEAVDRAMSRIWQNHPRKE